MMAPKQTAWLPEISLVRLGIGGRDSAVGFDV